MGPLPFLRADRNNQGFLSAYRECLININYFLNLTCSVFIKQDGWVTLAEHHQKRSLTDFVYMLGFGAGRATYNQRNFEETERTKKTQLAQLGLTWDFFVPILQRRKVLGWIAAGPFLRSLPSRADLERQWAEWNSQKILGLDASFLKFASVITEIPILNEPAVAAYREQLEILAELIAGTGNPATLLKRTLSLKKNAFAPNLPHLKWAETVIWRQFGGVVSLSFEAKGELEPWERTEIGIGRPPDTIIAAMPMGIGGRKLDPIDSLLRGRLLQTEAYRLTRKSNLETTTYPLSDYGILFLTSLPAHKKGSHSRIEMRDLWRKISEPLEKKLGIRLRAGIGTSTAPGMPLESSYLEATQALQWGSYQNQPLFFYRDIPPASTSQNTENLREAGERLVEACVKTAFTEVHSARDSYLNSVLRHSGEHPERIRTHFLTLLWRIIREMENRFHFERDGLRRQTAPLLTALERENSIHELLSRFREAVDSLIHLLKYPRNGREIIKMGEIRQYLERNFHRPLMLGKIARQAGLSRPVFSSKFRRVLGCGFNDFLLRLRVAEAKKLLRSTTLSVNSIAGECGFSSPSYFVRSFGKVTGSTPQSFRRKS